MHNSDLKYFEIFAKNAHNLVIVSSGLHALGVEKLMIYLFTILIIPNVNLIVSLENAKF